MLKTGPSIAHCVEQATDVPKGYCRNPGHFLCDDPPAPPFLLPCCPVQYKLPKNKLFKKTNRAGLPLHTDV